MKVFTKKQIEEALDPGKIISAIEEAFLLHYKGEAVMPPPSFLRLEDPIGEVHINCGHLKKSKYYGIKILSAFFQKSSVDFPKANGMMLLFDRKTGEPISAFLDEGLLTHIKAAAAGAVAARYLAPAQVKRIGIVGTGMQARLHLKYLEDITTCRDVIVWGRSEEKLKEYQSNPLLRGFHIAPTQNLEYLAKNCDLIITATPSTKAYLLAHHIQPGTHITAVGSDDVGKQELDTAIFHKAKKIVADSKEQCFKYGEIFHGIKEGVLDKRHILELGEVIANPAFHRTNDKEITIADLTDMAILDLQIASLTYERLITPKL